MLQRGIYLYLHSANARFNFFNNIIKANSGHTDDIFIKNLYGGTVNAYNNDFDPTKVSGLFTNQDNNINLDPLFVNVSSGDYHLSQNSLLINAGSNSAPSLPSTDYEGDPRISEDIVDIGADEYLIPNTSPIAVPNGPYSSEEGAAVILNASGSYDPDGTIVSYEWDINNDGSSECTSVPPEQTCSYIFNQQGNYLVTLKVTDNHGAYSEAQTSADISDTQPEANFIVSPLSGAAPLTVNFTNTSTGYDSPLTYEWDFDNNGTLDSVEINPVVNYTNPGTYTVSLTATDLDLSPNTFTWTDCITVMPTLTVNRSGSGTVTSSPSGIDCGIDCTELYDLYTPVTLLVVPDPGSGFAGWSGGVCNGSSDCTVTMDADKTVTAVFEPCVGDPVRISGAPPAYFSLLQDAYNAAANMDTIQSQAVSFTGDLNININKTVTFEGGYNCVYSVITGKTIVGGNIIINNGKATIENLSIEGSGGEGGKILYPSRPDDFLLDPSDPSHPTSTPEFMLE